MGVLASVRACWARVGVACGLVIGVVANAGATPVDFNGQPPSAEARRMAQWALDTRDTQGKPFAVVDKKQAKVFIFGRDGHLLGAAPALLGLAPGDRSVPGIGQRAPHDIAPSERTTPAGRFDSEPGHNHLGEAIVWVDYAASFAIHRLRPAAASERRPERLASDTPDDNRISLGCIVVSPAFFDEVVAPSLGRQRGVVYVLPETAAGSVLAESTGAQTQSR